MDEDIQVTIEDEAQEDTGATEAAADLQAQIDEANKRVETERKAREASEARAQEARRIADEERRRAADAETRVADSELSSVTSRIEAAQTEVEAAKKAIKASAEAGDWGAQAEAYDRLAIARANMSRLDGDKANIELRKTVPKQESRDEAFENYVSQYTAPTQRWMREHKEWITDPEKSAKLQRVHFHALEEGLQPDTDEYFEHVERRIGLRPEKKDRPRDETGRFVAEPEPKPAPRQEVRRSAPPPAAPVNGGSTVTGNSNGSGARVTLTNVEAKAANDGTITWGKHDLKAGRIKDASLIGQPIGNQEFARRKLAMRAQYDPSYNNQ